MNLSACDISSPKCLQLDYLGGVLSELSKDIMGSCLCAITLTQIVKTNSTYLIGITQLLSITAKASRRIATEGLVPLASITLIFIFACFF
jgi:hypothetical protein